MVIKANPFGNPHHLMGLLSFFVVNQSAGTMLALFCCLVFTIFEFCRFVAGKLIAGKFCQTLISVGMFSAYQKWTI